MKKVKSMVLLLFGIWFCQTVQAQSLYGYRVTLFNGNNATANARVIFGNDGWPPNYGTSPYTPDYDINTLNATINFRDYSSVDDKVKSAIITGSARLTLTFYKDADRNYQNDHCIVYIKQDMTGYILNSFESNYEDDWIKVTYFGSGDLDGEVSCLSIDSPYH